jgi:hypothetical protein
MNNFPLSRDQMMIPVEPPKTDKIRFQGVQAWRFTQVLAMPSRLLTDPFPLPQMSFKHPVVLFVVLKKTMGAPKS